MVLGLWLCAVGGFLGAHTFVAFQVFANAQTGNIVLLGLSGPAGRWSAALTCRPPIGAFVVGVAVAEVIARPRGGGLLRHPASVVLAVEIHHKLRAIQPVAAGGACSSRPFSPSFGERRRSSQAPLLSSRVDFSVGQ